MSKSQESVHKVTLSSGKVVLFREMKIKYQELAMKVVKVDSENKMLYAMTMQKELLKILIHSIEGKPVSSLELEKMDDVFSFAEYSQLMKAMDQIVNGGDEGEFQMDLELIGSK